MSAGSHTDERIVESVQDQGGHGYVLRPVGTSNAVVVVIRACEAAVPRDDLLVKLPHGANLVQAVGGIQIRAEIDLAT
jgi:hypothetical protein